MPKSKVPNTCLCGWGPGVIDPRSWHGHWRVCLHVAPWIRDWAARQDTKARLAALDAERARILSSPLPLLAEAQRAREEAP